MEKILITTPDSVSAILIGARWEAVVKLLPGTGVAIVTDDNVSDIYGDRFPSFPVLKIKPGEESKRLSVIEELSDRLLELGIDRAGFILGIGGGVVCDVAGFLASVFMRGIRFGFVSTTLLSQVDASTGGKNGVNLGVYKNVIGNFNQPEFVICDTTMLRTLTEDEYLSGLAELIKTGLIGDPSIVDDLENNYIKVIKRDRDLMSDLVTRSVKFKAGIVSEDEKESGLRRILNFGHTFGHAIELHESVKHGFAVAAGMELSVNFSHKSGLAGTDDFERVTALLERYHLIPEYDISAAMMKELVLRDKKKTGKNIHFVFLKKIGKAEVRNIPVEEVISFYRQVKREKK